MKKNELEIILEKNVRSVEENLKDILLKRSNNENKIKRLQENLSIWENYLNSVMNNIGKEFVRELDSEKYKNVSFEDKETFNDSFRLKTKELILKYNRKFFLDDY